MPTSRKSPRRTNQRRGDRPSNGKTASGSTYPPGLENALGMDAEKKGEASRYAQSPLAELAAKLCGAHPSAVTSGGVGSDEKVRVLRTLYARRKEWLNPNGVATLFEGLMTAFGWCLDDNVRLPACYLIGLVLEAKLVPQQSIRELRGMLKMILDAAPGTPTTPNQDRIKPAASFAFQFVPPRT